MRQDQGFGQEQIASFHQLKETFDLVEHNVAMSIMSDSLLQVANLIQRIVPENASTNMAKGLQKIAQNQICSMQNYGINLTIPAEQLQSLAVTQLESLARVEQTVTSSMLESYREALKGFDIARCADALAKAMNQAVIDASDMAFIKLDDIAFQVSEKQSFSRGVHTAIKDMRVDTAERLKQCESIQYLPHKKQFFIESKPEETASLTEMNVLCSGANLLGALANDAEFIDEAELIEFMNELADVMALAGNHSVGQKIMCLLRERGKAIGFEQPAYYHARAREKNTAPYLDSELLCAPHGVTCAGRFNRPGEAYYYFADTRQGAEAEVKKHNSKAIVQTIELHPVSEIRMIDLSGCISGGKHFLDYIRFNTSNSTAQMPREYLIPNYVSDCCRKLNYEGIKYYGSQKYCNYVSWRDRYFELISNDSVI